MDEILAVSTTRRDDVPIVSASGEIDVSSASILRDHLNALEDNEVVVLDLADVSFLDSTGIGVLIGALKRMRIVHPAASLRLLRVQAQVRKVLEVTGLDAVFPIHDDLDAALQR